jgi:hypothetical protein
MEVLGLSKDELGMLSEIRKKGKYRYSMGVLNIKSRNQLNNIRKWMGMPRHKRIEKLAPNSDNNVRDFLNNIYAFHRYRKRKTRTTGSTKPYSPIFKPS